MTSTDSKPFMTILKDYAETALRAYGLGAFGIALTQVQVDQRQLGWNPFSMVGWVGISVLLAIAILLTLSAIRTAAYDIGRLAAGVRGGAILGPVAAAALMCSSLVVLFYASFLIPETMDAFMRSPQPRQLEP